MVFFSLLFRKNGDKIIYKPEISQFCVVVVLVRAQLLKLWKMDKSHTKSIIKNIWCIRDVLIFNIKFLPHQIKSKKQKHNQINAKRIRETKNEAQYFLCLNLILFFPCNIFTIISLNFWWYFCFKNHSKCKGERRNTRNYMAVTNYTQYQIYFSLNFFICVQYVRALSVVILF